MKTCIHPGCDREQHGQKVCGAHYGQLRRAKGDYSRLSDLKPFEPRYVCEFDGCELDHQSKGLCSTHYRQYCARGRDKTKLTPIRGGGTPKGTCSEDYCDRPAAPECLCEYHRNIFRTGGVLKPIQDRVRHTPGELCSYPGCKFAVKQKNLCRNHHKLWYNYKLDGAAVKELFTGAQCVACTGDKSLMVDHDHSCCPGTKTCGNCIRGILCHCCNSALGLLKDNPETMRKLILYVGDKSE